MVQRIESDSRYAATIGFSKAVRAGGLVFTAGVTAVGPDGVVVGDKDPYLQAREALRKAVAALADCGADVADVLQTRMYLVDPAHWGDVGRAHAEVFGGNRPAATMVVVKELLDPRMLIEIEVVASTSG
jgi:enamine deaminase RidA (YjgF/YER057c/UK114 family)